MAKDAPPTARENPSVWLVHTLVDTAGEQFGSLVRRHLPDAEDLTVFGPYLDPSANATCELARLCGTSKLSLGVRQGKAGYVIPLEKVNALPDNTRYVVPAEARKYGFAHAKVFEVRSPRGCMVMTGSVNATNQSLFGLENVEVSLVRKLDTPAFKWKTLSEEELATVKYEACKFKSSEIGRKSPALDAQWQSDGIITGTVSPRPSEDTVSLEIWCDSEVEHTFAGVALEPDGSFKTARVSRGSREGARRLLLRTGDFTVTGWLNVESELAARPWEKELARAASRIRSGTGNDRDLRPVLNWMTGVLHRKPEATTNGKGDVKDMTPAKPQEINYRDKQRKLKELRSYQDWRNGDEPALTVAPQLAEESMAAAFRSLNDSIRQTRFGPVGRALGQLDIITPEQEYGNNRTALEDNVEEGTAKEQNAIDAMLEKLPTVLAKDATGPMVSGAVAMSATDALAEGVVAMKAGGAPPPAPSSSPQAFVPVDPYGMGAWLAQYSAYDYDVDNRERLLPVLCTFACCAYDVSPTLALGAIKEQIEDFAQREVPVKEWEDAVALGLDLDAFELVREAGATSRVTGHVAQIVASLTLREELELMLGSVFGNAAPGLPNPRYQKVLERLQELRAGKLDKKNTAFGLIPKEIPLTNVASCPNCRTAVRNIGEVTALKTRRVTIHDHCKKPVFAGLRATELTRYNVASSIYADWSRKNA
jgi:hypothetical protein